MPDLPTAFTAKDAHSARQLGTRPVFKIEYGAARDSFIVKTETTSVQIKPGVVDFTFDAVRQVAAGTKARALKFTEINEVYNLLHSAKADAACQQYARTLGASANAYTARPWVIMSFKRNLLPLDVVIGKDPNQTPVDQQRAINILNSMRARVNLERLGAMLVVDLFLNNEDRFSMRRSQKGIQRSGLENFGNVFFVDKGLGFFKLKALDPWDIAKPNAQIDQLVANPDTFPEKQRESRQWTGMMLKDKQELKRIAAAATDVFNLQIAGALNQAGVSRTAYEPYLLDHEHEEIVYQAMKAARDSLKAYCRTRSGSAGARFYSDGLRSRMELLGWT